MTTYVTLLIKRGCEFVSECVCSENSREYVGDLSKACLELRKRFGPSRIVIPLLASRKICLSMYFIIRVYLGVYV